MRELITIPISFFEFVGEYARPEFELWADRGNIVQGIFDNLMPWNPHVDDGSF